MKESEEFNLLKVREINKNRPKRAKEIKEDGAKIVGYFCNYIPLEILSAQDILPYRIMGNLTSPLVEVNKILPNSFCPFIRSCGEEILSGEYDFLDGVVGVHSCDPQEKCSHALKSLKKWDFFPYLDLPHTIHSWSREYFKRQIEFFKDTVEKFSEKRFSIENLNSSIKAYNQQRNLLRKLYDLKKTNPPKLNGVETLQIIKAMDSLPVYEANKLLEGVIAEVGNRQERTDNGTPRIMLCSACHDSEIVISLIEQFAEIVMDDNCMGSRKMSTNVRHSDSMLESLSDHYLCTTMCPRTFREEKVGNIEKSFETDLQSRFGYLNDYVKEWNVDGVIILLVRFCDPFSFEIPDMVRYFDKIGIPAIYIEYDYSKGALAGIATKVQAFTEMLQD